ncbi:hypothetical protein [Pedobacter africanus]|uniref:Uncharacterized protein n=1 Tax=Pedobacter africanus TaxID=151894 RepID=A0A1W2DAQ1_9SPHI|nr:hypothetical protein [Pedobacter africanus]SMC94453.1 hypothetical protein SAMN04488524_3542 [Pedobacter africanus]
MKARNLINYKSWCSKWLLAVVLLLSFFNFSGFTISAAYTSSDKQQTSFLGESRLSWAKSISYKRALNQIRPQEHLFIRINDLLHLAEWHTLLLNAKIANCRPPLLTTQKINLFYRLKSVAKNDEDELHCKLA